MNKRAALLTLALAQSASAFAAGDPVEMAHQAGFTSCDTAIETTFERFMKAASRRVEIKFDENELPNHAVAFTASYGNKGDSVIQHITVINTGETCFTSSAAQVTDTESCDSYQRKFPEMRDVAIQADLEWVDTEDGVTGVLKDLPEGGCAITIAYMGRYDVE